MGTGRPAPAEAPFSRPGEDIEPPPGGRFVPSDGFRRGARRTFALFADLVLRLRYDIRVSGREHYAEGVPTLLVANHRSDADGPIVAAVMLRRQGVACRGDVPFFVAREDLFARGFLAQYVPAAPAFLRPVLGRLCLAPFLELMRVRPMRRVAERTLGEVLAQVREIAGDVPLAEILKASQLARYERLAAPNPVPATVGEALAQRYRALNQERLGLLKLRREMFQRLARSDREVIARQVGAFVALLEAGKTVFLAPEGVLSPHGCPMRSKAGLHLLLTRARVDVHLVPVGLTYDFMTTGRPAVFVRFGRELSSLEGCGVEALDERVHRAIAAQYTATATQIASVWLRARLHAGENRLEPSALRDGVMQAALDLACAGLPVDGRLLDPRAAHARIAECLGYCRRVGLLDSREGRLRFARWPAQTACAALDHACNELAAFVPESLGILERLRFVDRAGLT
ncbi:MAG: hypothetical protein M0T84_12655 [Betaproteobacteria bacterium]|nr:hypothetical protein [Betaproteobacteria bacterium]